MARVFEHRTRVHAPRLRPRLREMRRPYSRPRSEAQRRAGEFRQQLRERMHCEAAACCCVVTVILLISARQETCGTALALCGFDILSAAGTVLPAARARDHDAGVSAASCDGATIDLCSIRSSQSSSTERSIDTLRALLRRLPQPLRHERMVLRRKPLMTAARSSAFRSATGSPSHGAGPASGRRGNRSAQAESMLSPSGRAPAGRVRDFLQRCMRRYQRADCLRPMFSHDVRKPARHELKRSCQSTVFHSPPCFTIGVVSRSSELRPS